MAGYAIFDVDGTLLDSMGIWYDLDERFLQMHGIAVTEDLSKKLKEFSLQQSAEFLKREFHLPDTVPQIMEQISKMVEEEYFYHIPLKPGVEEYLAQLKKHGVRMCVATASEYEHVSRALERLGVDNYFEFILTCTEIGYGKDSPNIFRMAAERLGAEPREVTVYEDALYALRTARAAGFRTAAVYDRHMASDWGDACAQSDFQILEYQEAARRVSEGERQGKSDGN